MSAPEGACEKGWPTLPIGVHADDCGCPDKPPRPYLRRQMEFLGALIGKQEDKR